jgi:hypothetical protein
MSIFWELFFTIGGWFTWALAAVAVGTAVYSGVSANQAKKKAQGQAGAADKAAQEALDNRELFVAPPTPLYMPWNFKSNQARAIEEDANAYARSDKDYKKRHGGMVGAEAALESEISKDWKGEHELMPQMQAELAKAGIFKSLDALGGTGGASVLAPGSAGEANVARHLGLGTMAFQDRNRNLRHESLKLGEEVFPRRQFGMTGADYVSSSIADVSNKNAWEAANYEREFAAEQARIGQQAEIANARQASANATAQAQALAAAERDKAVASAVSTGLQGATQAYGSYAAKNPGTTSVSNAAVPRLVSTPGSKSYGYTPSAGWKPTGGVYA